MRWLALMIALLVPSVSSAQLLEAAGMDDLPSPLLAAYVPGNYGSTSWRTPVPPTISCVAAASGGDLTCSGATFTKSGAPTTVASPYAVGGVAQTAVKLDGAAGFTGGDDVDATAAFTVCTTFKSYTVAVGTYVIVGKAGSASAKGWQIQRGSAAVQLVVYKNDTTFSATTNTATIVAGQWNAGCFAYDPSGGDGAASLRANLNGVIPAEVTTGVAPGQDVASVLAVGQSSNAAFRWVGAIGHVAIFSGRAFSAAELATAVRAMQSSLGQRPPDSVVTTANAAAEWVPSQDGQREYLVPANTSRVVPYIAGSSAPYGLAVYGANSSRIERNQRDSTNTANGGICGTVTSGWTVRGTAACQAAAVADPFGTTTAERITVGAKGADDIFQTATGFTNNAPLAATVWVKRVSTSGTLNIENGGGGGLGKWTVNLASLPDTWTRLTSTHPAVTIVSAFTATAIGSGGQWYYASSGTAQVDIVRPWLMDNSSVPGPDFEIQATIPGTRGASVVSVANVMPADSWCVTEKIKTEKTPDATVTLFSLGSVGAANSVYLHGSGFGVFDGAGAVKGGSYSVPLGVRTLTMCAAGGVITLRSNGSDVTGVVSGAGTGIMSAAPVTAYLGNRNVSGWELNGLLERACFCKGSNPIACESACLKVSP